jgi:hypothetical protein
LQPYYPTTRKNLLGFTQEFDNAAWTKTRSSISATKVTAPDGSLTGQKLVENTDNSTHFIRQSPSLGGSAPHTVSVYLKAAERTEAIIRLFSGGGWVVSSSITVNLSTGSVVVAGSGATGSAVDAGNGWYRVSITQATNSTTGTKNLDIFPALDGTDAYLGDGTSGIFIWGAQLSDSASLDPYVYNPGAAPASTAYYGPRFDYDPVTLAPKGLLIEEQRTNSIRNNTGVGAVAGTPGTLPTNWFTFTSLTGITREVVGVGTDAGVNYVDVRLSGTPSGAGSFTLFLEALAVTAAAPNQIWTNSAYVKLAGGSLTNTSITIGVQSRTAASGFVAQYTGAATPTSVLTRAVFTSPALPATTERVEPVMVFSFTAGVATDITLRIGLPQLELGAFATSVIPTTTAAATRAADVAVMTGANFSNWYNATNGTLFSEYINYTTSTGSLFSFDDNTINNRIITLTSGGTTAAVRVVAGGVNQVSADIATVPVGTVGKIAFAYKLNDFAASVNASTVVTDTSGTVPAGQIIARIGSNVATAAFLNGHIRRLAFFPRRLANAELQGVTA